MKRLIGVLALSVVAIVFAGKAVLQERGVTLRFKFPVNQVRTYEVSGEMAATTFVSEWEKPITFSAKGKMTAMEKVESVDNKGVATLVVTTKGQIKTEKTVEDIPPSETRMKVTPLGKVLEVQRKRVEKTEKENAFPLPVNFTTPQIQGIYEVSFPENPVKVGDIWDISTKIDFKLEDRTVEIEVKGKARLVGFEKIDGRDCAVIETTAEFPNSSELIQAMPVPEGKVSARSEGQENSKIWFDIAEGLIVRSETNVNLTMKISVALPTGQSISGSVQVVFRFENWLTKVAQGEAKGK